jgi:hypothetical protein
MDDAIRELIDASEDLVFAIANLLEAQYAAGRSSESRLRFEQARQIAERHAAWERARERWKAARRTLGDERPVHDLRKATPESPRADKLTARARRVLPLAQEEAQRFSHNYIGTEHILLGIVREGQGVAARVLTELGVDLNKVRSSVEFIIGRGDRPSTGAVGLTPRAKKVIELSVDEARRLNHHYVGTEHLLLGLLREGEGIAAGVLESLGVSLDRARNQIIYRLNLGESEE